MSPDIKKLEFIVLLSDDLVGGSKDAKQRFKIAMQDSNQFSDLQSKFIELKPIEAYIRVGWRAQNDIHLHYAF